MPTTGDCYRGEAAVAHTIWIVSITILSLGMSVFWLAVFIRQWQKG